VIFGVKMGMQLLPKKQWPQSFMFYGYIEHQAALLTLSWSWKNSR